MEEDIEILKGLLNYWKKLLKEIQTDSQVYQWVVDEKIEQYYKAIENLIKRNKELEKRNTDLLLKLEMKKLLFVRKDKTTNKLLSELYIRKDELEENYISKSKVREKIEEIKEDENPSLSSFQEYAQEYSINKLQELLQEGDDK